VTDLKAEDFGVYVDDRSVDVQSVLVSPDPLNVFLVLDMSPSGAAIEKAVKAVARRLVDKLRPDDKLTMLSFAASTRVELTESTDRKKALKKIENLQMADGTSVYEAVTELFRKSIPPDAPNTFVLLVTDGVDTTSRKAGFESALVAAEKSSVPVFLVYFDNYAPNVKKAEKSGRLYPVFPDSFPGLGKEEYDLGRLFLTDLVKLSGGRVVQMIDFLAGMTDAVDTIPSEMSGRYRVVFRLPEWAADDKRHTLKVRVKRPNLVVLAKGSVFAN
jgi:hypothetical protein